jgi:hypothetical protein
MLKIKSVLFLILLASLAGCATSLTPSGEKVRIITESQRDSCEFIKIISYRAGLGPDKPGSALKGALNEVAKLGGNGLYIITNTVHWADGATVSGEALKCKNI